jgi:adenosylcobinamide-GDP ribazoletransferase
VTIALAQAALAALALRQIGGQTGDVLGAGQQIGALAAWLAVLPLA